ncbi:MAG: methyltransferase domain-containing protein [candidate division Zixibacteria bacterium]|nr:methyltransferase domain-containing protein [candidate division Zixibacteria bacterium]
MAGAIQHPDHGDAYLGKQLAWATQKLQSRDPSYRFKWDIYFDRLEELARSSQRFLDAGCGDNKTASELNGPELCVGVDIVLKQPLGTAVRGTLEHLPFRNETFDLVGCRYVAEHLSDPETVWRELHRVMQPGGRVLIQTVNAQSLLIKLSRRLGGRLRRLISRKRYARRDQDVFPVVDRFNAPDLYRQPPTGFRCVSVIMTQDVDTQSRLGFYLTYLLVRWTQRRPDRRSTITAEWERI